MREIRTVTAFVHENVISTSAPTFHRWTAVAASERTPLQLLLSGQMMMLQWASTR
jgi:hypothetical protein